MITPAAVASLAAEFLGGNWKATPGPWQASGVLDAPGADTYTLTVDERGELRLTASLAPCGPVAVFREPRTPQETEDVAEAVAEAIRQDRT